MSFIAINKITKTQGEALMRRIGNFFDKNAKEITKFLNSKKEYRSFRVDVTRYADGKIDIDGAVYEIGKTHYYLTELTKENLIEKIKELEAHK